MKLLFCKNCDDVIRIFQKRKKKCKCGKIGGKYLDKNNAVYFGEDAVPVGFANSTFYKAIDNQPEQDGSGEYFTAFVISKICSTFKQIPKEEF